MGLHRFQYGPFGGGPRGCVGARFASAEALTILAHWLAGWRFERARARPVRVVGTVMLRPENGLPLRLVKRSSRVVIPRPAPPADPAPGASEPPPPAGRAPSAPSSRRWRRATPAHCTPHKTPHPTPPPTPPTA